MRAENLWLRGHGVCAATQIAISITDRTWGVGESTEGMKNTRTWNFLERDEKGEGAFRWEISMAFLTVYALQKVAIRCARRGQ